MNRKLKRYIEEEKQVRQKIKDLEEYLKALHAKQKIEEDQEILKTIRNMKLGSQDLLNLLTDFQSGKLDVETFLLENGEDDEEEDPAENADTATGDAVNPSAKDQSADADPDEDMTEASDQYTEEEEVEKNSASDDYFNRM